MKIGSWISLVLLALLWGGAFVFLELALRGMAPISIVFFRLLLASATLFIVVISRGQRIPRGRRVWAGYMLLGLLTNLIPFLLLAWAQQSVSPGITSTICALTPVFTLLIARVAPLREPLTGRRLAGIGFGLAGVAFLLVSPCTAGGGGSSLGILAALLAAFSYGCGGVTGKYFDRESPLVNAAAMLGCSTVMLLPVLVLRGEPLLAGAESIHLLAVVCLAELSTAGGFVLYFALLRDKGPLQASWISFLVPISTALLGAVFLRQFPEPETILAGMLVLTGLFVMNRERRQVHKGPVGISQEGIDEPIKSLPKPNRISRRHSRLLAKRYLRTNPGKLLKRF